jgi:6-phosphogluconolactonase
MEAVVTNGLQAQVAVFSDIEELSHAAAERFVSLSRAAIISHGIFATALSGGSTPRRLYSLLGMPSYCDSIDWKRVHVFWADERCVPPSHESSNYKLAADTFLVKAAVPVKNIHRIRGEEGADIAAAAYQEELRSFFTNSHQPVFDLVVLGAGVDGHTASLFPGSPWLRERSREAVPVYKEKPEVSRVSLALPVLNNAADVIFLVSGEEKADMVCEVLKFNNHKQYPAGLVQPANGRLSWFLDKAAAARMR